jgi:hypothetical protein
MANTTKRGTEGGESQRDTQRNPINLGETRQECILFTAGD